MENTSENDKRTFAEPHKLVRDSETGFSKIDMAQSESYVMLEALGQPRVVYAKKANKYFRDVETTKLISDKEITDLGLPTPNEIAAARHKLIDEFMAAGKDFNRDEINDATAPSVLKPRKDLDSKIYQPSFEEATVNKLNRATLAK